MSLFIFRTGYISCAIKVIKLKERLSFEHPHAYSEGVRYLLVNGKLTVDDGKWNGTLAGEVIKLKE
ncbi:MAG: hypothetical protein ABIL68_07035 [bacterium]